MKIKVALVTGGYSSEAEISYKSAKTVFNALDKSKFEVYQIDIHPTGWWYENAVGEDVAVDKADFSIEEGGEKIKFDVALMCIHGTPGEDGKLQGYFDMIGLPYTSCDTATSALTFNKRYTVAVAGFGGIGVAKSLHLFKEQALSPEQILSNLSLPVFVKPNNGGSSIGVSKVNYADELENKIKIAFKEGNEVLIENFLDGQEVSVGVIDINDERIILPITEIISENELFDYNAKYLGESQEITPGNISNESKELIHKYINRIYDNIKLNGITRSEFIIVNEDPHILETNTVPGFTKQSIVPQQIEAQGLSVKEVINNQIKSIL